MTPMKADIISNRHTHTQRPAFRTVRFTSLGWRFQNVQITKEPTRVWPIPVDIWPSPWSKDQLLMPFAACKKRRRWGGNKGIGCWLFTYCLCVFHPKVGCDEDMGAIAYNILPFFWARMVKTAKNMSWCKIFDSWCPTVFDTGSLELKHRIIGLFIPGSFAILTHGASFETANQASTRCCKCRQCRSRLISPAHHSVRSPSYSL